MRITVMQMECWGAVVLPTPAAYIRRTNTGLFGKLTQLRVCALCCNIEQL